MHRGDDAGKIFVGGLSYDTTTEGLESYFSKYGEVTDSVIMKAKDPNDPRVERSRGFGFVTFRDASCVQKVIDNRPHFLDHKEIDPKPAVPRAPGQQISVPRTTTSRSFKCFIGGVAQGTSEDDLKAFFSSFGPVAEVTLMKDAKTGRMRGFGFVGFHSEEAVQKICAIRFHQVNGKTVEAKKAEPKDSRTPSVISGNVGGPAMGRAMSAAQQQPYMAGYGMNSYGQADARSLYGGYGQSVGAQASPYGVPVGSSAASVYSSYASSSVTAVPSSYADRGAGLGQEAAGGQAYAGAYGTMGVYGAVGAPSSAGRYNDFGTAGQGPPTSSAGLPGRADGASDFSGYGAYGLGNYAQEASQYGPTRGGLSDSAFGGAPTPGGPASVYGADQGYTVSMYESMGRGGANSTRGYHPYGR